MEEPMPEHEALRLLEGVAARVRDPLTGRSLQQAGMLRQLRVEAGRLLFQLAVSAEHSEAHRRRMLDALARQLAHAGWDGPIDAELVEPPAFQPCDSSPPASRGGAHTHSQPALPAKKPIPGVGRVVAVASGKGGVGKSTVAVQLALALLRLGHKVGIMDADIYGPSLPTMLGIRQRPGLNEAEQIVPIQAHGLRCMSVGFLVAEGQPLIWRGPVVMGLVRQFVEEVDWAGLDYLVIDLPPGTGDAQLTLAQLVPLSGAVIVSTPGQLALMGAVRGLEMFRRMEVPILGVVENMAWYQLPDGTRDHPFGQGGARGVAEQAEVPLLAEIPIDGRLRAAGDEGRPGAAADLPLAAAFDALADALVAELPLEEAP